MRMNLNQQSHGAGWQQHRNLMASMSPIVDCGVHYVDVMCQMTGAKPVRVSGRRCAAHRRDQAGHVNYGALQVAFADGSVGWHEAGWGPMMSEVAFFVKDVIGPKGAVSIVKDPNAESATGSNDIDSHTKTNCIRLHHSETTAAGEFAKPDELINTADEPDHQALCDREQEFCLQAIREERGSHRPHAGRSQQPADRARGRRKRPYRTSRGTVRTDFRLQAAASGRLHASPFSTTGPDGGIGDVVIRGNVLRRQAIGLLPAARSAPSAPLWRMPSESVGYAKDLSRRRRADRRCRNAAPEADRRRPRPHGRPDASRGTRPTCAACSIEFRAGGLTVCNLMISGSTT